MPRLILARHGETPWNREGLWTGLTDVELSDTGHREAAQAGAFLSDVPINRAFASRLRRARQTVGGILRFQPNGARIPIFQDPALNEKDYGIYTGKSKAQVREEVGDEAFQLIRRSWDYEIEGGESLSQVHTRVVTFHVSSVVPCLERGETVLVGSHNNTLRAYVKELEGIPEDEVGGIELGTAEVRIYEFDPSTLAMTGVTSHRFGDVH